MKVRKGRKDRIFIFASAVVVANLSYQLIKMMLTTILHNPSSFWSWTLIILDIIAIIGMLWLIQNYRRRRRIEKEEEQKTKYLD